MLSSVSQMLNNHLSFQDGLEINSKKLHATKYTKFSIAIIKNYWNLIIYNSSKQHNALKIARLNLWMENHAFYHKF